MRKETKRSNQIIISMRSHELRRKYNITFKEIVVSTDNHIIEIPNMINLKDEEAKEIIQALLDMQSKTYSASVKSCLIVALDNRNLLFHRPKKYSNTYA